MKTKTPETRVPPAVEALARAHGLDPQTLLAWAVRADGRAVIIARDGRKYVA